MIEYERRHSDKKPRELNGPLPELTVFMVIKGDADGLV